MSHQSNSATFASFLRALCVLLFPLCAITTPAQCKHLDTLYYNAHILTGVGLTATQTPTTNPEIVQALGIVGDTIQYTGTREGAQPCLTPTTQLIDLHGAFVMPGFNDAHTHMADAGQQHLNLDLDNTPSLAAMQASIASYAKTRPPGSWITGGGWDHTKWSTKTLPTRQDLDAVTGQHPAYLERTDGHIAIVNTAALTAAGITAKTLAPPGAQIDLDPTTHEPTGIIREAAALALVQKVIPLPDAATRRRALQLSIDDALAHGVTSVQDFSTREDFQVLEAMEREQGNKLPLRFAEWMPFDRPLAQLKQYQASHDRNDPYLHTTMLKAFMDGSLGSRTAALAAPYTDDPKNSGLPRYDQTKLNQMTSERTSAGFQLGFHAIGDQANRMALEAFTAANETEDRLHQREIELCLAANPEARRITDSCGSFPRHPFSWLNRFRIEHAQVLLPADFDRFAKLGVIASMQPSHLLTDMAWATDRLGPERSQYAYAWRSMLDHHITLAFGTDYPVESISPFRGLYAALTRQNVEATATFHPEQILTLDEALYAYTQASAFAEFAETRKGILAPSYLADFIVLDRDLTTATPQQVLHTRVLRTVVGGITRYQAPPTTTAETPHHNTPDTD